LRLFSYMVVGKWATTIYVSPWPGNQMPWAANRTSPPSALCLDGVFCPQKSPLGLTYLFFYVYFMLQTNTQKYTFYEKDPSKPWDSLIPLCNYVCTREKDRKFWLQNWCMGMGCHNSCIYNRWRHRHISNNTHSQKNWKDIFLNWVAL